MSRQLLIGTLFALGSAGLASASFGPLPPTVSGDVLSGNTLQSSVVGTLPTNESQSLVGDQGFRITGSFTFDTSSTTDPTVSYTVFQAMLLPAGTFETSSFMKAGITDTSDPAPGYVKDFTMTTELFSAINETSLTGPIQASFSNGGQTGFSSTFCPLADCGGLSSGGSSGPFTVAAGEYFLQQTFTMSVSGVNLGDSITIDLPVTSGVGSATPEPGYCAVLAFGIVGLLVARRRFAALRN